MQRRIMRLLGGVMVTVALAGAGVSLAGAIETGPAPAPVMHAA